jgi:hypothetical protein
MTLALRRTVFLDGERSTGRELWRSTQSGIFQPSRDPNGGVADTLDEAKAAFRAAWSGR